MPSYTLHFSDPTKSAVITVPDTASGTGINNYDTSLELVGSGYQNYGNATAQNFLKLLENSSGPNSPINAIEGQLWYDTSNPDRKVLKVNNGSATSTRWRPVSGIYQQSNDPTISFSSIVTDGDLWVDTQSGLVKLRHAGSWENVGPSVIFQPRTGSEAVVIESTTGDFYPITKIWANGSVIEIISSNEFTPKAIIDGFYSLKIGTNLTNKVSAKYNGVADKAYSLQTPTGLVINAVDVLKNNVTSQTHTGTFIVESGNGLIVKKSSYNKLIKIYNDVNGSFIDTTNNSSTLQVGAGTNSYLKFNGYYKNIGINTATTSASPTLDVFGTGRFLGTLTVSVASSSLNSIVTNGKIIANSSINVGTDLTVGNNSNLNGILTVGTVAISDVAIINPAINDVYDIGTTSTSFRTLYVSDIGNTNTFTTLYGHVVGTADKLTYPRALSVSGQIITPSATFDGSGNVSLTSYASPTLITAQSQASSIVGNHTLMVYNTSTGGPGILEKTSKNQFLSDVYPKLLLTGMITAYSTSTAPSGFLLCDGSVYSQITYSNLYSVIGSTYGGGPGTFRVPNLSTATYAAGLPIFYIIRT